MVKYYYFHWHKDDNRLELRGIKYSNGTFLGEIGFKFDKISPDLFDYLSAETDVKVDWSYLR